MTQSLQRFHHIIIVNGYDQNLLLYIFFQVAGHQTAFINELKLVDFKQILNKNNISSEFSGGVLWCCNGTVAVRRVCTNYVQNLKINKYKVESEMVDGRTDLLKLNKQFLGYKYMSLTQFTT